MKLTKKIIKLKNLTTSIGTHTHLHSLLTPFRFDSLEPSFHKSFTLTPFANKFISSNLPLTENPLLVSGRLRTYCFVTIAIHQR